MTAKDVIKNTMEMCQMVLKTYIEDLNDADLMIRSVPGANHIAWQLGHLISSEHHMMTGPGYKMPDLPANFAEAYTPETSKSDDPTKFHKKAEYLALIDEQRKATLATLDSLPEADLDKATPEDMQSYVKTIGAIFNLIGMHDLMHAGQFVPVRRKLDKPRTI
jgi:hypothetical protein